VQADFAMIADATCLSLIDLHGQWEYFPKSYRAKNGTVASLQCGDGYTIAGKGMLRCLDDGSWDGFGACVKKGNG